MEQVLMAQELIQQTEQRCQERLMIEEKLAAIQMSK